MPKLSLASPPPALLDRVEGLQTTAEYITALAQVVENQIDAMRGHLRDPAFQSVSMSDVGNWDEMYTILSLLRSQADIVRDASMALEDSRHMIAA